MLDFVGQSISSQKATRTVSGFLAQIRGRKILNAQDLEQIWSLILEWEG